MARDWNHLPAELKIQILKELVTDDSPKQEPAGQEVMRNALVARRVCKSWEDIMNHLFSDYIDHCHIMIWGPERLCRQIVEADLKDLNKHIEAEDDGVVEFDDTKALEMRTFLWNAINRGLLSCVKPIMDDNRVMEVIEDLDTDDAFTFCTDLLHDAIAADKPKVVSLLLEYKWMEDSIHDIGSDPNTPLANAIVLKRDAIVDILLDHGANPDVLATWEVPTLDGNATTYTVRLISLAVERNDTRLVRRLVESGLSIEGRGECHSIIVDALLNQNVEIVNLLIQCGAEITRFACPHSDLPLQTAIRHCSLEAVKSLVNAGADLTAKDYSGEDALTAALIRSESEFVSYLLDCGAPVKLVHKDLLVSLSLSSKPFDTIDDLGHYCSLSCMLGLTYATHIALKRGVSADYRDPDGPFKSLLDAAVHHKRADVVRMLLKDGADASNIDPSKLSAVFKEGS